MAEDVTKGPGYDWLVTAEFEDGSTDDVAVYGCITIEKAIEEARYSFSAAMVGEAPPFRIVRAEEVRNG
jgi:hypothetical protein